MTQDDSDAEHLSAQNESAIEAGTPSLPEHADVCDPADVCDRIEAADAMLRLHSAELITRLQDWATDLGAREAQLNARVASQEQQERTFRMRCQAFETEMGEQQRRIERLRDGIERQARRLAFTDLA